MTPCARVLAPPRYAPGQRSPGRGGDFRPFALRKLAWLGDDDHRAINTAQQRPAAGQGHAPAKQELAIGATKTAPPLNAVLFGAVAGTVAHPTERLAASLAMRNSVNLVHLLDKRSTVKAQSPNANATPNKHA